MYTTCDGCYCAEAATEACIDADVARAYEDHVEHDVHRADCYLCEDERVKSADFTRCWKCGLAYRDGRGDHIWHGPPYCFRGLPTYPVGVDWGYLRGRHVTLVGTRYSVRGVVVEDQAAPDPQAYIPIMYMQRTDEGYEDPPGNPSPFNPREWVSVDPAPRDLPAAP